MAFPPTHALTRLLAGLILSVLASVPSAGAGGTAVAADESIHYVLTPDPEAHELRVELVWHTGARDRSLLSIAARWASVESPASFIDELQCDAAITPQSVEGSSAWLIKHEPRAHVRIEYRVRTGNRSFDWDRTYRPIVAHKFFHGIGHTFLLTPDPDALGEAKLDVRIEWRLPESWPDAACSLGPGLQAEAALTAGDLRQTVFLAGSLDITQVEKGGRTLTVAMHPLFAFDVEELIAMASRIIDAERAFMREQDFPSFLITAIPVGDPLEAGATRHGGTGLYHSVALFLPPMSVLNDDVAFLLAHEVFHHWNGRILQRREPEELVYWFSEGFTDYYSYRILAETFPTMHDSLASRLNRQLRRFLDNPARLATNEEVRTRFWLDREAFQGLPYQRGLVLAMRWHTLALQQGVPGGVDAMLQVLVANARDDQMLLSNQVIRDTGIQTLGAWFADEFDRFADGGAMPEPPADAFAPMLIGELAAIYDYAPGFDVDRSLTEAVARGVIVGSAAHDAGLREGDLLLGWDIVPGDPDREWRLHIRRGDDRNRIRFHPRGSARSVMQYRAAEPGDRRATPPALSPTPSPRGGASTPPSRRGACSPDRPAPCRP